MPADRTTVTLRAAPLNHHDPWTLKGVGIREEQQPMILGSDVAGLSCRPQEMAAFVAQSRKASGSSARACGCRADREFGPSTARRRPRPGPGRGEVGGGRQVNEPGPLTT
ncbi:hypothetical protein BOG92_054200 [Streptomyces sp. WAC00263]|nr:hypothetical protein BOG92_054200 [Streptomyces sp. WAC00263]